MKYLKDITKEQAIEIAKMIWDFDQFIKSDFEFKYFDGNYGHFTKTDDEQITITFDFEAFPEKRIGKMFVHIFPNLDCSIAEFEFKPYDKPQNETNKGYWQEKHSYPLRNQNAVQKKFIEWDIEPITFGTNKHTIRNNTQTLYLLLADGDGTTRSKDMPFGVVVTTKEEAERYVKEGGVGYSHAYEELKVFDNKDNALNWKFKK